METVQYGKQWIEFELIRCQRRTLEIAVLPDSSVVVKAPSTTALDDIHRRVKRRARWIVRQIDWFKQFSPVTPPRRYVGGETHLYLGRQYRLKLLQGESEQVKLIRGYFEVSSNVMPAPATVKALLDEWYRARANQKYQERLALCWPAFARLKLQKPSLTIRRMKTRWGSLSKTGILTLNLSLVRVPLACVDYVITHELCHLVHHDHSARFYQLLEKMMPDWQKRKHRLELALV